MTDSRTILHIDLDAFFAAVEQRDDPSLRGKPVLVGGSVRRGVVSACSYEARVFGIHSAMPMAEAMRRCPHAILVPHRMERYAGVSREFMAILGDFSPVVESLSFDEAFLDVTGSERLLGDGVTIARTIKARVRSELQLVASVGVAPIKFAAKIASDINKPDGLREVTAEGLLAFLHPLPVSRLWGAGEVTQGVLASMGLRTIGDVARYPHNSLIAKLGPTTARHLIELANGRDARLVEEGEANVTVGHQETFDQDVTDVADLESIMLSQADRVGARLRRADQRARTVAIAIKYDDFRSISRRITLPDPTSDGAAIARAAIGLLAKVPVSTMNGMRVRLAGVSATGLEDRDAPRQLGFSEAARARGERLGDALDKVAAKFGTGIVQRAVHVDEAPAVKNPHSRPLRARKGTGS